MITSGLVIQKRARYIPYRSVHSNSNFYSTQPFVDGFDKASTNTSKPFKIENGLPPVIPIGEVKYQQVFGKGSTADDRDYFMKHGETRKIMERRLIQQGARPRTKKVTRGYMAENVFPELSFEQPVYQDVSGPMDIESLPPLDTQLFLQPRERERSVTTNARYSVESGGTEDLKRRGLIAPSETSAMDIDKQKTLADLLATSPSEASFIKGRMENIGLGGGQIKNVVNPIFIPPTISPDAMSVEGRKFSPIQPMMDIDGIPVPPPPPPPLVARERVKTEKKEKKEKKEIKAEDIASGLKKLKKTSTIKKELPQNELQKALSEAVAKRRSKMEADLMDVSSTNSNFS